jgi:N-succinyldiaminopimelate aminotransferase
MNPLLSRLQPYPFERLRQLFASVTPNPPPNLRVGLTCRMAERRP